ncbi:MAG: hypothetical protein V3R78_10240 [Thermodesulfobacteriota bacterium]
MTPEQKKVIAKFREQYFAEHVIGVNNRIPLADFMVKGQAEQVAFIKTWTQERYQKMIDLEVSLTAQQGRVAFQKEIARKALSDWEVG